MLVRFAFAAIATAVLVVPTAAEPPTAAAARSKEQIKFEVRVITVADDFFDRIAANVNGEKNVNPKQPIILDHEQLYKFLESLQGDVRTTILQMPITITSNDKTAVWHDLHEYPCERRPHESVSLGYKIAIRPRIVAGRGVALNMNLSMTSLDAEKPSRTTTHSLKDEWTLPAGHSVLLGGWKQLSEGRCEYGPPVGSGIPYMSRLFPKAYKRSTENVLILVTATIVEQENK